MRYLIDSANINEIEEALALGFHGVTSNPSMYLKEEVKFKEFLHKVSSITTGIITAEVMGEDIDELLKEVDDILSINKNIIIKINFSPIGLKLINILSKKGIKTAITLIFNLNQATLAMNAGTDYIFPFIGRNDEIGDDGLQIISDICETVKLNNYKTKVVAASIKNLNHLNKATLAGVHYAAVTYSLLTKAMHHELSTKGAESFKKDWNKVLK